MAGLSRSSVHHTVAALAASAFLAVPALSPLPAAGALGPGRSGCTFVTVSRSAPAFCDTFDRPLGTGNRSGQLNGNVWGVSRATSSNNPPQGLVYNWAAVRRETCGRRMTVEPESDVAVCDGQAIEAVNDNGGQTDLAMYPRQPFDFAGRTGTVEFDVSDNTQGSHAAWPAFLITDQPVPAPYSLASGLADHPRNAVGFTLAAACGQFGCGGSNNPPGASRPGFKCVGVDSMFVTVNYHEHDLAFDRDGCVLASRSVGSDNHVEVRVNSAGMRVFASDPGRRSITRLIADAAFKPPLTRGLIWLEDVHYNADKFNSQQTNTFSWDNVAFDGPILPRDLGFDVLDSGKPGPRAENGLPTMNLGYQIPSGGGSLALRIPNVSNLAAASGALLEFTYWAESHQTITYSLNGHTRHRFPWPFGNQATFVSETAAMPVPTSDLHDGVNLVRLSTSDPAGVSIANVDLILKGAGGLPPAPAAAAAH